MDLVSSSNSVVIEDLPNELPTAEDVDALLNSEMCQLSLDERNKVYQDIHGVSDEINETPDLVAKSHHQLDLEIEQIREKTAYDLACSIDRNYVMDKDFRMRFLRSTLFDAKAAATKMVQFFEMKRDLFGQGKLARDITQNDLSKEDLIMLYSGYQQYLPVRDSAGRAVAVLIPQDKELDSSIDPKNLLQHKMRRTFYNTMVNSQDEDIQKRGIVFVVFSVGIKPHPSVKPMESMLAIAKLQKLLPMRLNATHVCYDNAKVAAIAAFARTLVNTFTRVRARTHYGTYEECMKSLLAFGIPTYALPFDEHRNFCNQDISVRLKKVRDQENKIPGQEAKLIVPGPFDVLVGRRKLCRDHTGNVRYRNLVEKYKNKYEEATTKFDKTAFAMVVVKIIQESSGRFLKDDGDGWVEVDDNTARAKVAHCFRTIRPNNEQKWKRRKNKEEK